LDIAKISGLINTVKSSPDDLELTKSVINYLNESGREVMMDTFLSLSASD